MKRNILLLLCMAWGIAQATLVAVATPGLWNGYSGNTIVVKDKASLQECMDGLVARGIAGTYSCRTSVKVVVKDVVTTCPPPPAPNTRTQQCPTGTTGTWTQTSTSTVGPPPACTVTTVWEPASPPSGSCPPVASTPPLVYSTTIGGIYAQLNGATVSGPINVRVGGDCATLPPGPWVYVVDGSSRNTENLCPYELVGDNALVSFTDGSHTIVATSGQIVSSATFTAGTTPPPVGNGQASLRWTPPTQNTDGSALSDLAGFRILYGRSQTSLTQTITVPNAAATSYTVTELGSGDWFFTARAYSATGGESTDSNLVQKTIP